MTRELATDLFRFLKQNGCTSVHIGGGEPLLRPDKLFPVLEAAVETGIGIDYVETNAAWHKTPERTATVLRSLRERSVDTLLISMDPFHNAFIPFRQVKDLMRSCHENGMQVFAWKEAFFDEMEAMGDEVPHDLTEWASLFGGGSISGLIRRYGLGLKGRALETFRPYLVQVPLEDILRDAGPCTELAGAYHFHLDLHGQFIPQSCQGLSVHYQDAVRGALVSEYPVFARLHEGGIGLLLDHARETYGFVPDAKYAGKCDLCWAIRRYLALDRGLDLPDLQPHGHYLHVDSKS